MEDVRAIHKRRRVPWPGMEHAVVEAVVKFAAGRVPVIAGAGSNNTVEGIRLIQHADHPVAGPFF